MCHDGCKAAYGLYRERKHQKFCEFSNYDAGECVSEGRITILHRNIPKMLTQFTAAISVLDVNIANLVNKSRGNYAYTVIDVDTSVNGEVVKKLKDIEGVLKVRVVK